MRREGRNYDTELSLRQLALDRHFFSKISTQLKKEQKIKIPWAMCSVKEGRLYEKIYCWLVRR